MAEITDFTGFPKAAPKFLRALKRNNDKAWFAEHREEYDRNILEPARAFVVAMGDALRKDLPGINADPRTDRSIFRIHRDIRFSKDKSPYKAHLGVILWDGPGAKMESSGFYLHLEPPELYLGCGYYMFSKESLAAYRELLLDPKGGPALQRAVKLVAKRGYEIGADKTKRVPRGCDPDHPRAELLKHKGLFAGLGMKVPPEFHGPELVTFCRGHFKALLPLHKQLRML